MTDLKYSEKSSDHVSSLLKPEHFVNKAYLGTAAADAPADPLAKASSATTSTGAEVRAVAVLGGTAAGSDAGADGHATALAHAGHVFGSSADTVDLTSLTSAGHAGPTATQGPASLPPSPGTAGGQIDPSWLAADDASVVPAADHRHHDGDVFSDHFTTHSYHDFG